ncbi:25S rRNA (adenine645-N1)-methyltransferase [Amphichorda felina]
MFAVPGWSVSADTLKTESVSKTNASPSTTKSNKRKRGGAAAEQVTSSNVADLFESVVEGKKRPTAKSEQTPKRQKKNGNKDSKSEDKPDDEVKGKKQDVKDSEPSPAPKKDKKKQKQDAQKPQDTPDSKPASDTVAKAPAPLPPAPPKLTPLQASMRQKLISARFRHLNETLYTRPSEEAFSLFQESPEMFDEYHEGFRRQVKVWPENPVDSFLADIRRRGKARAPPGKGGAAGKKLPAPSSSSSSGPLPRTAGTCTIADLGCGDARLAESLQKDKDKLRLQINSYDLQSPSPLVTKADIANLPLADGSVNVSIFCLALMGTNWIDFVEEAYRILHWKGELWIAEIKSRFGPVRSKNAPVVHSVGNRRKTGGKKGKGDGDDEGAFGEDLAVEVDGVDDHRRETDVSAFVEVLRKRGFVLKGERKEAIDLSNRMFVKMHFIKGAAPTKGKGVKAEDQARPPKRGMMRRDLTKDDDEEDGNEASILKPCVYKIR